VAAAATLPHCCERDDLGIAVLLQNATGPPGGSFSGGCPSVSQKSIDCSSHPATLGYVFEGQWMLFLRAYDTTARTGRAYRPSTSNVIRMVRCHWWSDSHGVGSEGASSN
jgi:hypothetical protein